MIPLLTANLGTKLLSVALALLLWVALLGEQDVSTTINVPVEYKNFPQSLEISTTAPNSVYLQIRAPSARIGPGTFADTTMVVDLSRVSGPGENTFNLSQGALRLPADVVVERVVPSQVRLRFEQRVARDVPVAIRYAGAPMPGYRIRSQEVLPEVLRIIGPQSRVERMQEAETDPIDLNGVIAEREFRVNTFVDDPQVRIDGPSIVRVRVVLERVEQATEKRK